MIANLVTIIAKDTIGIQSITKIALDDILQARLLSN